MGRLMRRYRQAQAVTWLFQRHRKLLFRWRKTRHRPQEHCQNLHSHRHRRNRGHQPFLPSRRPRLGRKIQNHRHRTHRCYLGSTLLACQRRRTLRSRHHHRRRMWL